MSKHFLYLSNYIITLFLHESNMQPILVKNVFLVKYVQIYA